MESKRGTPIVQDKDYVLLQGHNFEPPLQVAEVIHKPIGSRRRLSRVAHPNQVWSQTSPKSHQVRDHIPPQIGRSWISMEEDKGRPFAGVDVTHFRIQYRDMFSWVRVERTDLVRIHS